MLVATSLFVGACGPIEYVNTVTRGASSAVEAARTANAAKWSPYWWTRAVEYLHQAREEAAYADFQAANRFGRLAEEAATKAREEALRRAGDPEAAKELDMMDAARRPASHGSGGLAPVTGDDETPPPPRPMAPVTDDGGDGDDAGAEGTP
ncbi:MAG: DUF4398 domain-containing protein [Kofleriaceae bacterium]|nr:DUF4398 domain-containing protein [Myxococcales bacterium]MCB9560935.1 DUF4398 domain-containing protein [Kofleriaceae bacterium]MCB9574907.1 DUF4398 domain-containing protein [Kofleriaceae bacterium]